MSILNLSRWELAARWKSGIDCHSERSEESVSLKKRRKSRFLGQTRPRNDKSSGLQQPARAYFWNDTFWFARRDPLFEGFEERGEFAAAGILEFAKDKMARSCIPESFVVGHYRVKHDSGLHFPVNSWDALTTAPFWSVPPPSAEKTWPRFFIAVRTLSPDLVSSPLFF